MFSKYLFYLVAVAAVSRGQTVVYTTGADGSLSAYLIAANSTAASSRTSAASVSSSPSTTFHTSTSVISSSHVVTLPTAVYTGQALLTGTCNLPQYTALVLEDGGSIHVPLIGCSDDRPECCPSINLGSTTHGATTPASTMTSSSWTGTGPSPTATGVISILSAHPLSICPHDMVDVDPVCCPAGFTKWGQAILGNTPCASLLSTSFTVPSSVLGSITSSVASSVGATMTGSDAAVVASPSVTVIVNQVFALGIPCADDEDDDEDEHKGLSAGAKGGIGAGAAVGAILLGLSICACIAFRRRRQSRQSQETHVPEAIPPSMSIRRKPIPTNSYDHSSHVSQSTVYPPKTGTDSLMTGYPYNHEYGQGFVDGIKAAMSPPMHSPGSPPPTYGFAQRPSQQAPVEAPSRASVYVEPAELSVDQIHHSQRFA